MAEIAMTEETSTPSTPSANKWKAYFKSDGLYILDDAGVETGPFEKRASLKTYFDTLYLAQSGWIEVSSTWTYASASTITVPSGAASLYQKGMAVRFKQGGAYKYYNLWSVADTLLTVFINTDYTVANAAITNIAVSFLITPLGFPSVFTLAAPTWTTTGTAFTNQPGSNDFKYSIEGSFINVGGTAVTNAASGGTGEFIATWAAGSIPTPVPYGQAGIGNGLSSGSKGFCFPLSTGAAIRMGKYDNTALAGNSQQFGFNVRYKF